MERWQPLNHPATATYAEAIRRTADAPEQTNPRNVYGVDDDCSHLTAFNTSLYGFFDIPDSRRGFVEIIGSTSANIDFPVCVPAGQLSINNSGKFTIDTEKLNNLTCGYAFVLGAVSPALSGASMRRPGEHAGAIVKMPADRPSAQGASVVLHPVLSRSLETQRAKLKSLALNWDGYGAEPIAVNLVDGFVDELRLALSGYSGPLPDIIPGADGSLQVEWHLENLELLYGIDSDEQRYLYLKPRGAEGQTSYGREASMDFAAALLAYFRGGDEQTTYVAAWR